MFDLICEPAVFSLSALLPGRFEIIEFKDWRVPNANHSLRWFHHSHLFFLKTYIKNINGVICVGLIFLIPSLKFSCIKAFSVLNIDLKNITLFTNKCRHL